MFAKLVTRLLSTMIVMTIAIGYLASFTQLVGLPV